MVAQASLRVAPASLRLAQASQRQSQAQQRELEDQVLVPGPPKRFDQATPKLTLVSKVLVQALKGASSRLSEDGPGLPGAGLALSETRRII